MFGHRFFGRRYYGPRYWGDGGGVAPVVVSTAQGDAWPDEIRKRLKRAEHDRKPQELDKAALREMLEDAFEGPKPEAVQEVLLEHRLPRDAPRQAYRVDWSALLADLAACEKALRAHERRVEASKAADKERRAAQIRTMVELIEAERNDPARLERRRKLRRVAARIVLMDMDD